MLFKNEMGVARYGVEKVHSPSTEVVTGGLRLGRIS